MPSRIKAPIAARNAIRADPQVTKSTLDERKLRVAARVVETLRAAGVECELDQASLQGKERVIVQLSIRRMN